MPYTEKSQKRRSQDEVDALAPAIRSEVDPRFQRKGPGPAYLTNEYLPMSSRENPKKPCKGSKRAGTIRDCQVELNFLSRAEAEKLSRKAKQTIAPGPTLRFCIAPEQPGVIVPVKDPLEAKRLTERFCRCVTKTKGKSGKKSCALNIFGKKPALAGRR